MKSYWKLFMALGLVFACAREEVPDPLRVADDTGLFHDMIQLGEKLDDPYTVANMQQALLQVHPTKAGRLELTPTDLYVRFLPRDEAQIDTLRSRGLTLTDHPMDYRIVREGDWYHDPLVAPGDITWQYAVVGRDFAFPEDIRWELLDECYLSENDPATRASDPDIDWDAVERAAFALTGNEALYVPPTRASGGTPEGRITIEDPDVAGGKPLGVSGVMVCCNSFVKFATAYTDRDGYYRMSKRFSSSPRFRLVFTNRAGFDIGLNLVLVPASVSTLGTGSVDGLDFSLTAGAEGRLFRRCVVNNAVYDYIERCREDDLNLPPPPKDLRIWIFSTLASSSTVMLHHGTVVEHALLGNYLADYAPLIRLFGPDLTIGCKDRDAYADIYTAVQHELAHTSHFVQAGKDYWNHYIAYILRSFLTEGRAGREGYGTGDQDGAGYCEVGETWAYFLESSLFQDRYGGSMPAFGTGFWFYPQIFRTLYSRGMTRAELFRPLKADVTSRDDLQDALLNLYEERESLIRQTFLRYSR